MDSSVSAHRDQTADVTTPACRMAAKASEISMGSKENGVPDMRHIKHNHTYTVPPGEAPKERKSDIKKVRPPHTLKQRCILR